LVENAHTLQSSHSRASGRGSPLHSLGGLKYAVLLAVALALSGCAYLPREPFCTGAKSYRGLTRRTVENLPFTLRKDVEERSGVTFETWYEGQGRVVVIAVSPGRGDIAFTYSKVGNDYRFESEEEVPCLQE